jgi:hypothetical protein
LRRKFGFNKKISRKLVIVNVYYQPIASTTTAQHGWAGGTILSGKKVPPQQVYLVPGGTN